MDDPVAAFWCRIPSRANFGDALTPWLIRRISGRYPQFLRPADPREKLFVCGSIIGFATGACTVWGSGIMAADEPISSRATLLAVRGPLTRQQALRSGTDCPEVYGDPALLLPRFYQPTPLPMADIGVALHYSDRPRIATSGLRPAGLRLIDMQDPVERVIDQLTSCRLVASSSLHGLIASHAYGVPATWIEFRALPSGDRSKFRDYLGSLGVTDAEPLRVAEDRLDPERLWAACTPAPVHFDVEPLWRACPLRASHD